MDILPLRGLGGSANIVLSSGRAMPTKLTGSYSGNTGLARVRLAGLAVPNFYNYRGNQLSLSFFPGAPQPERVTGKILGQTVRE